MLSFDGSALNRLAASITASGGSVADEVAVAVRRTAMLVEGDAKQFAPVDTGFLRNSIGHDITESGTVVEAEIGPTADYGHFVEFGTSRMPPYSFMGPALDRNTPGFVDAVTQAADRGLTQEGL